MSLFIKFLFTVVFGFLWWWVYNRVGPGLAYLVILGSVLAVCVCCCKDRGGDHGANDRSWNFQVYYQCIRRCWLATVVLMVGLFFVGIFVIWLPTGVFPTAAQLTNILIAAVGAPLCVRAICCAYEG
jgi:hypothetical protein